MKNNTLTIKKLVFEVIIASAVLLVIMFVCAAIGSQDISFAKIFSAERADTVDYEIFFKIRIPRIILAALVGAALAGSGVVLQAILRNPLADPYILGVSSGAGLGVMLAVITGIGYNFLAGSAVTVFAFAGALVTVWIVWFIGHFTAAGQTTSLLLAGVVINAFFSAIIMFLTSIAQSHQVYSTIFWLMGNITEKPLEVLYSAGLLIFIGLVLLFTVSQRLNLLAFGQTQAKSMGVNTTRVRLFAFAVSAFITAVAVSLSGLIGFVGLIVPHAVRLILGADHRRLLAVSALAGAGFLVIADTISRTIVAPAQLPVGVITAIAGGPFFLILLAKYSRKVSWYK
jgi:iron complex transport system permease protein